MYDLKSFKFWCQKVLPLVYDDSLSYYELLCKVVDYLNKTIDNVNELGDGFKQLNSFVKNYFNNLNVTDEINQKLDEMARNGTLDEIINQNLLRTINIKLNAATASIASLENSVTDLSNGKANKTELTPIQTQVQNLQNIKANLSDLNTLLNRVDALIAGGVTTDSEIVDARTGVNGTNYSTLGQAIRAGDSIHGYTVRAENYSTVLPSIAGITGDFIKFFRIAADVTRSMISDLPSTYSPQPSALLYIPAGLGNNIYNMALLANATQSYIGFYNSSGVQWNDITREGLWNGIIRNISSVDPEFQIENLPANTITVFGDEIYTEDMPVLRGTTGASMVKFGSDNYPNGHVILNMGRNGTVAIKNSWNNALNPWKYLYEDLPVGDVSMYHRIGGMGDSFMAGSLYDRNGNSLGRNEHLSWLANLARQHGIEYANYGVGGATTKTWFDNQQYGYGKFMSDGLQCGCYFLNFGINDSADASYLGDPDDMQYEFDSFYGNYAKIINLIQTTYPNARIVILGLFRTGDRYTPFNEATKTIAEYFGLPWVNPFDDYYIYSINFTRTMHSNHPTPQGYASMARAVDRLYHYASCLYADYFGDYIGNDYTV